MASELTVLAVVASVCAIAYLSSKLRVTRRKLPYPPGPRPLPIIGNALSIPTKQMAPAYREMCYKYGDVVYLESFGQPIIVLGTHESALDLLEKRSAKYADKVHSTMATLAGWDWALPIMTYGSWWRRSRKAFHEFFNLATIPRYRATQLECARRIIARLARDPDDFPEHIRQCLGFGILSIAYGIDIEREKTPYMAIAAETMATFAATFVPGKYLVETFPSLRFLPSWLPGARFKREGKAWKPIVERLRNTPWDATVAAMKDGVAPQSIVTTMLERTSGHKLDGESLAEEVQMAKDTAAATYAGGADTLFSAMMAFFLAMAKYPDVQRRAQAELDAVVGPERLPGFDDKPSLPYIAAIIKECIRWRITLPLGIAHHSMEDDEYRGYYIPKGTVVIPNVWAYSRDTRYYSDPEEFRPERYLKDGKLSPGVLDPGDFVFGYGRRGCPGRDFAEATLFALTSHILHTLKIGPPKDAHGKPMSLDVGMTDGGVLALTEPFECTIVPRSAEAETLISSAMQA
ncbi:cytochrome P450 [Lenzites betulinus]|nr:cytochrome P450 [Lenzites betulinus]